MLADWARKQWRREEREKGRVEGRALEREAWQNWSERLEAWEQRRTEAESEGRAFTEPRPAPPVGD